MKNISLIVACDLNFAIGKNNQLLCHLPKDLAWFKNQTLNKTIIMGRKTFDSIGRPLPKRTNVVLSRSLTKQVNEQGVMFFSSLDEALNAFEKQEEVMIIGGAEIYRQALPYAHRIYLTQIQHQFTADAFFPSLNFDEWAIKKDLFHSQDEKNPYDLRFLILERDY